MIKKSDSKWLPLATASILGQPPRLNDFSAVIFDMDGLVLDTEPTYFIAWQQAAKAMGYKFSEEFCLSLSGLHYNEIALKLVASCGVDFNLQLFNQLSSIFWREQVNAYGINVKYGFTELLEFIVQQHIPYCLATNSRASNTQECLELAGIKELFSTIITRDDVEEGKPAPDIFLKAAELLQVPIGQCLVLEDSYSGIEAASRAGAFSVLVPSTQFVDPLAVELCDLMIVNLMQVLIIFRGEIEANEV
jgi:beta-phosphoglucomutase-like phosphatase (HAD superfamily)